MDVRPRGSHVVMQRRTADGTTTVPVPDHPELKTELLQGRVVETAIARAIERLRMHGATQGDLRTEVERELAAIDLRLKCLANAIASANDAPVPTLVATMKAEEQRKAALIAERDSLRPATAIATDLDQVTRLVRERAGDIHELLDRNPDQARRVPQLSARKLDAHPIEDERRRRGYRLVGEVNVAGLLPEDLVPARGPPTQERRRRLS